MPARMPRCLIRFGVPPSLVLAIYLKIRRAGVAVLANGDRSPRWPARQSDGRVSGFSQRHVPAHVCHRSHVEAVDLEKSSWVEVCWYFPVTHEQFRIGGHVTVIGEVSTDAALMSARLECWRTLPEPTRLGFTWPAPGGRAIAFFVSRRASRSSDATPALRTLLAVHPEMVDFLEINGNPQNRWRYHRDEHGAGREWKLTRDRRALTTGGDYSGFSGVLAACSDLAS